MRGRGGVGEGELVVACGVGGGSRYGNLFGSVRFVEGDGHCRQRGAFGRESSGNRDVVPDDLLSGGGGGGYGGGDGDEGDDRLGAHGGLVGRSARGAHYVGMAAGGGVGEGELVEAGSVSRGSGDGNPLCGLRSEKGEGHGCQSGAFCQQATGDGDVAADDLLSGGGGGGDGGGGDGDEGDDHLGALQTGVGPVARGAHHVGVVAGDGVGEGELVVASGIGGGGSYGSQLCDVVGVVEGNECFGDGGAVCRERSGDGDVAPDDCCRGAAVAVMVVGMVT